MLTPLDSSIRAWQPGSAPANDPAGDLAARWPEIVGPEVGQHSHPLSLNGATLLVLTRSSVWSEQLSFLSEDILGAIAELWPAHPVARLRFRVGRLPRGRGGPARDPGAAAQGRIRSESASPSATAEEALGRFRAAVDEARRAKRAAGWKDCQGCSAVLPPGDRALCAACSDATEDERIRRVSRLLFEAPQLGYRGVEALVPGLAPTEYEGIRRRTLRRWWETLVRAARSGRLSRDGRERSIAGSYVLLKSGLPPERVTVAIQRNELGDDVYNAIYGTETTN